MTLAILNVDWQTLADAPRSAAIYALMAVGIGLVFGVLRLVNFAYGQLVMAGAYALAFASQWNWPGWAGIVLCFAVVLALSVVMDRLVFRPLRTQSPAVMLVATFAVAFLLQSIALLVRAARQDRLVARAAEPAGGDLRRRHPQDRDRRGRRRRPLPRALQRCCSRARPSACRCARLDGLPHRTHARRAREPRDRRGGAHLRGARRGRRDHAHRPDAARDARLRAARHDRRARRRRARRPEPAGRRRRSAASRSASRAGCSAARCRRRRASTCRRSCSPR